MIWGYMASCKMIAEDCGATYADQAKLSISEYPYCFMFLITPLIDRFYFRSIGKCRTYLLPTTFLLAGMMLIFSSHMQYLVENIQTTELSIVLLSLAFLTGLLNAVGESWLLTLYSNQTDLAKGANYIYLGEIIGYYFGQYVFIPLNDVDWLNDNLFTGEWTLDEPLITHSLFCRIISVLLFIDFMLILIAIMERPIDYNGRRYGLYDIYSLYCGHFTNAHMRSLIIYVLGTGYLLYSLYNVFDYTLVSNGYLNMGRSTITIIDACVYPFTVLMNYLIVYFINKGKIMKMYHLNLVVVLSVSFYRYFNILDLMANRDLSRAIISRILISPFIGIEFTNNFLFAYYNLIVDERYGTSSLSLLSCMADQTVTISNTIAFMLMQYMGFKIYALTVLTIQAIILITTYSRALLLDTIPITLYRLDPHPHQSTTELISRDNGNV